MDDHRQHKNEVESRGNNTTSRSGVRTSSSSASAGAGAGAGAGASRSCMVERFKRLLNEKLIPIRSLPHGMTVEEFENMDISAKYRMGCDLWAQEGLGTPVFIHLFYVAKVYSYLRLFLFFQSFSDIEIYSSNYSIDAFQRFVTFNMLFEGLGLGCGSGPLGGRFFPPFTACFHWFCPGTIRIPWRANQRDELPPTLSSSSSSSSKSSRPPTPPGTMKTARRSWWDLLLNTIHFGGLVRAVVSPRAASIHVLWPVCASTLIIFMRDHVLFLASRSEHYGTLTLCTLVSLLTALALSTTTTIMTKNDHDHYYDDTSRWIYDVFVSGGTPRTTNSQSTTTLDDDPYDWILTAWRINQFGIWFWAAISKWGSFFPPTIQSMMTNSPAVPVLFPRQSWQRMFRSTLYQDWPNGNFLPSKTSEGLALLGKLLEFFFPISLVLLGGDIFGPLGLLLAICFHVFILANVALGVPQEWNVFCIIAAVFLYGPTIHTTTTSSFSSTAGEVEEKEDSSFAFLSLQQMASDYVRMLLKAFVGSFVMTMTGGVDETKIVDDVHNWFPGLTFHDVKALPLGVALVLIITEFVFPVVGNLYPTRASFLLARRYYAGNWPGSAWLIRHDAWHKLNTRGSNTKEEDGGGRRKGSPPRTVSRHVLDQIRLIYTESQCQAFLACIMAFRSLHLNSRILCYAIRRALEKAACSAGEKDGDGDDDDDDDKKDTNRNNDTNHSAKYQYLDGEMMAGWALGHNFGDGYWHGTYLLQAIQEHCQFEPGECVVVTWDSIPFPTGRRRRRQSGGTSSTHGDGEEEEEEEANGELQLQWWAHDATNPRRILVNGAVSMKVLSQMQPYDDGYGHAPSSSLSTTDQKKKVE